jgi:troponin T
VAEEEERRVRMEEDRKKKEEAKRQKQQAMGQSFAVAGAAGGRNFVVPERKEKEDKFGNIVQAKQEMGMTKEQQDAAKESFISAIMKSISLTDLLGLDLKNRIKELHQRICKLETDKFDLEKRQERQIYDVRCPWSPF